jgi:extracellular factor (EF) 3-hydroxypalmitic acid methyl ester biosynthesis protein
MTQMAQAIARWTALPLLQRLRAEIKYGRASLGAALRCPAAARDGLPPEVTDSIKGFCREVEAALLNARSRKIESDAGDLIAAACERMKTTLSQYILDNPGKGEAVGARVYREAFPYLMMSALFQRSYTKPRGYAGDFETIEMIYRAEPRGAGPVGRMIDAWNLATDTSEAVRSRRARIVADVKALVAARGAAEPLRITSMAVGSGREVLDLFEALPEARMQVTGIDLDAGAIAFCAEEARKRSLGEDRIRLHQANLVRLAFGRDHIPMPRQDFVYSMGLIDYFTDDLVIRLIDWAHDQLLPGGTLALGNFATGNPERPYMDYVLDWKLIHRTPAELRQLLARSKFGKADARVDADPSGIQLFAYCTKT